MENEEEETIVEPENGTINQRDAHPKEESAMCQVYIYEGKDQEGDTHRRIRRNRHTDRLKQTV